MKPRRSVLGGRVLGLGNWAFDVVVQTEGLHDRGDGEGQASQGRRVLVLLEAIFQRRGRGFFGPGVVGESPGWGSHCAGITKGQPLSEVGL